MFLQAVALKIYKNPDKILKNHPVEWEKSVPHLRMEIIIQC